MVEVVTKLEAKEKEKITFGELDTGNVFSTIDHGEEDTGYWYMKVQTYGKGSAVKNAVDLRNNDLLYFSEDTPITVVYPNAKLVLGKPTLYDDTEVED